MAQQGVRFFKGLSVFLALAIWVCFSGKAAGVPSVHPAEATGAPPALQSWRDWVRYQQEFRQCPLIAGTAGAGAGDFLCAWPGALKLEVGDRGVTFAQRWQVAAPSWVPLPGDGRDWPQEVSVNGSPQPVLSREGVPSLWLTAGDYGVRGRIVWPERPQALTVPAMSALVALNIDGKPIRPLQREGNRLTLGRSTVAANEAADSVELQVYRKLTDGIPAQLTTRIQLQVSGKAREIEVAPVLPEHFVATALETPWPARLDAEGRLQVQVQPGQATLVLSARAAAPLAALAVRLPETLTQEVWSYEAVPALRVTAVTTGGDAMAVDPRQAGVPSAWQSLPAFAMGAASHLKVEERSRGLAADETNRLTLARELWLDFSGDGYFAKDAIRGRMQQGWRFDVASPYRLQRAGADGEALLVTQGFDKKGGDSDAALTGVEWRSPQVGLEASVRIAADASARLPVTGWRQTFDQVSTTLHLPYGYKLLAAPGADAANDSWLARWTILDVFFAAFIALLAWRLLGLGGGIVTAAYLLLALPEPGAPLWTLAVVLALALLVRALPGGRLGKVLRFVRYAALAVFFLMAIAFAPDELRSALYPQLERTDNGYVGYGGARRQDAPEAALPHETAVMSEDSAEAMPPPVSAAAEPMQADSLSLRRSSRGKLESPATGSATMANKARQRYAQSNVVQTGTGEPDWSIGQHYNLRWTGPVLADQSVRFIISPPWLTRLLRVAMVVLLGVIVWRVARGGFPSESRAGTSGIVARAGQVASVLAVAAGLLAGAAGFYPSPVAAQETAAFPPEKLLQTLQQRVNQAPRCAPECAGIARADIDVRGNALQVRLEAHAGDSVALPLPAVEDNTVLLHARVDSQVIDGVRRHQEMDFVALSRGVHLVELEYVVLGGETSLHFGLRPMRVTFSGEGWRADGLDEDRLINETVRMVRVADAATRAGDAPHRLKDGGSQQLPPYVRVTRHLRFDLDWTANTVVTRLSPREGGVTLAVPLLAGEHVTTPGVKVQGDAATASLGHSEFQTGWQSRLDKSGADKSELRLTAPALAERAEVWRIEVSPSWHVRWEGVPVTLSASEGEAVFEFHPLPGETLTLTLTSPPVVEGRVRAIDHAAVEHAIGMRASQHTLSFTLRASQGGEHVITLPSAEMEVLNVMRGRESLNLRPLDGKLTLPVSPGAQTFSVTLREPREAGVVMRMPAFDLGLPVANIDIKATLPEQRWLLATTGPAVGPAVLYWGELVVALVLAFLLTFLLARRGWTSLRFHHWFLLVLGFSTFSWTALALIVCWLLALDWRQRAGALAQWRAWQFNGMQVGLALLSVVALVCLIAVIPSGLLGMPDMGVAGHGSYGNRLSWFSDQSGGTLPVVAIVTLPMWVYRAAMLVWALWLAQALIGWLRRGLAGWMQGGYWRKPSGKETVKEAAKETAKETV